MTGRPVDRLRAAIAGAFASGMRPHVIVVAHEHGAKRAGPSTVAHDHDHDHPTEAGGRRDAVHRAGRRPAPAPLVTLGPSPHPRDPAVVGRKALSLHWLARHGVAVPAAVAVPVDVADRVARRDSLAEELVAGALRRWLDPARRYAVRSSADVEDGEEHSFAGQFETRLDLEADDVLEAVRVVAAPDGERLRAYMAATGETRVPRVAVVIQEMVSATAAGVAFSRNPLTGLDEVVVEAVPGRGDALVGEGVTPDRWVHRWGAFTESPDAPRVDAGVIEQVARETSRLATASGHPVDLEWAHDGTTLWWLQARPMTGLDGLRVYSNRIAREVLPGVIKPLVWSVNVPIVDAAWIDLLEELVGPLNVRPEDLARSFGHRAYFDMTTLGDVFVALGMPRDALELLLGLPKGPEAPRFKPTPATYRHLPRLATAAVRSLRRGRWARREVAELQDAYGAIAAIDPRTLDEPGLLARVEALTAITRRAAYANIIVPILMLAYVRALEHELAAAGIDPQAADPTAGRADRLTWDPNADLATLRQAAEGLSDAARDDLAARGAAALADRDDVGALHADLAGFLARFGHLSASGNDFSVPPWREDPDHVVAMILAHPERGPEAPRTSLADAEARVSAVRRPFVRLLWRRAGAFRVYREAVSSTYTRGYGLFRGTFLALGERLVARGLLDEPDDVFYLSVAEVRALAGGASLPVDREAADGGAADAGPGAVEGHDTRSTDARERVARRRVEVEEAAELVVPDIVYGDAFVPHRRDELVRERLRGIPTSRGSVRGPARVVRDAADFGRVRRGDVIVIPFSDVGWTPLFARAAGVIAEAGGILSHSSIVAREYGIPCVVSVTGACAVIPDGAFVVLDGVAGTVLVEDARTVFAEDAG
jgi:phosphohistidine swiveling domain-containing protein